MNPARKVVVTGGAGFIGSHLAEELAGQGYHVVILDDLSSGTMENMAELLKKQNVEFVRGSVTDFSLIKKLFKDVQYVFHQAAISSVPKSVDDPLSTHEANLTGTLKVLQAARDNKVKKVVFASSASVYGTTTVQIEREDMMPSPLSPYAVTKLAAEYYFQVFRELYQLPSTCLRYFNVYGPREDPNSQYGVVIPMFIRRIGAGKPPIIFGDGEQTRDFIFVKDIVQANIWAAESDAFGIFNIGHGESITVNRLAELILELTGSDFEPIHQEARPGEVRHSLADISKARSFGYEPRHSLREGLAETIKWFLHR
jgi:UDP-glucose 4-epimerase